MLHRLIALLAAAAALAMAGCASGPSAAVAAPLEFTAETLQGAPFSGESLSGKPAVLWFWAPWCPVCQGEAPMVARVAAANPLVTFVGVGAQDGLSALQEFATKYGVDKFTELADTKAAVWSKFGITRQPAYAFVTPDGGLEVVRESLSEEELTKRVETLGGR